MLKVVVILYPLLVVALSQPVPEFTREQNGILRVLVPGFPGVSSVTISVEGQGRQQSADLKYNSVEGNWRTSIPEDVVGDAKHYVIEYRHHHSVYKTEGPIRVSDDATSSVTGPITRRYLERRATTVFFDDFSSGSIDLTKWTLSITGDGGGNEEFNMYTPEPANAFVRGSNLYIKPTLTVDHFGSDFLSKGDLNINAIWGTCTTNVRNGCHVTGPGNIPPIMSAKLLSKGHIRYGKVTVHAKMPKGDWLWPAIWMMPTEGHYGEWPRSGEIDILETRGNLDYHTHAGDSIGADFDHVNVHWGTDWRNKTARGGTFRNHGSTLADRFHSYWMDWTQDYIRLGIDDHTILAWNTPSQGYFQAGRISGTDIWASGGKDAPFDRPFYLILNVAVGGRWFREAYINGGYPQPWHDWSQNKKTQFWNARHLWQPTWHGDDVAMKVSSVKLEQY